MWPCWRKAAIPALRLANLWGKFRAPKPMRQEIFDLPLGTLQKIEFEGRVLGPLRKKRQLQKRPQLIPVGV